MAKNKYDLDLLTAQRAELHALGPGSSVMCVTGAEALHLLQTKLDGVDACRSCAHTLADLKGFCARLPLDVLLDSLRAVRTDHFSEMTLRIVAEVRGLAEAELRDTRAGGATSRKES